MRNYLLVVLCVSLLQCKQSPYSDLSGAAKLKGIVMIADTLSGKTVLTPAKNIKVYLGYKGTSPAYLYSTNADGQAQYVFNGIDLNKSYTIYASTDTGVVKYYGEKDYDAGGFTDGKFDTLKLYASEDAQNGIHLIVQDSTGGRVPNVTAWVFSSPVLFAADSISGKDFDMVTNENGISNRYNLSPITYYLRVKTQIGNVPLAGEASVTLSEKEIKTVTITLRRVIADRNGIELKIVDKFSTPIAGATSYFYRSGSTFLADTISYSNSLFKLTSNSAGLSSIYFIDPATYFLRTIKVINKDTLSHMDTLFVDKNIISTKTIQLQ